MRRYNQGWKCESERHSLARRGIKTGKKSLHQLGLVLLGGAGYVGYKMGKHKKHEHKDLNARGKVMKAGTIDIEPKWADLCAGSSRGSLDAKELMPACKIADRIRQAQKNGKKSITFHFPDGKDGDVEVSEK